MGKVNYLRSALGIEAERFAEFESLSVFGTGGTGQKRARLPVTPQSLIRASPLNRSEIVHFLVGRLAVFTETG